MSKGKFAKFLKILFKIITFLFLKTEFNENIFLGL